CWLFCVLVTLLSLSGKSMGSCPTKCTCVTNSPPFITACSQQNLTSIPEDIPVNTEELYFSKNQIHSLSQGALSRYENLKNLLLSNCEIEVIEPNAFSGLIKLITLDLRFNKIQQLQAYLFSGLIKLQTLRLEDNDITSIENFAFQGLNLTRLNLDRNEKLRDISGKAFHSTKVEQLRISNSSLSSETAEALVPLKDSLRELHWQNNQKPLRFATEAFVGFTFRALKLNNNGIKDIDFLEGVVTDELSLDDNPIGPIDFSRYPNLRQVRKLHLSNTSFSIVLASYFNDMTHLSYLGLEDNGISSLSEDLRPIFMGLQYLLLKGNTLHCNCELRWLKRWLTAESGVNINNGEALECVTPSVRTITSMDDVYFTCSEPVIVTISRTLNVSEEEGTSLTCIGEGDPAPTIIWSSPNGDVASIPPPHSRTLTENQGIFHIRSASLHDRGEYACTAVNLAGNNTVKVHVNV
ncbi:hypothetical protein CAPTEDRAFT_52911, partial [Capitella teleta]